MIRTGLYIYSQVIPFGSIFAGTPHQFPLLWESSLVTLVMIPAGILVYRDDTGRTVSEKLAQRARIFPSRPVLGSFLVMLVIVNVAYLVYGAAFAAMKWSRATTSVACPWPFPDAKVYDPQGFYEKNGQKGPYSVGIWSTYMSGQPDGRPNVTLGSKSRPLCGAQQWVSRAPSSSQGASRGLGFASAAHLYKLGWRVVGAMRTPDVGLERLHEAAGAPTDDPRLIGVQLDLTDTASIAAAAKAIETAVGAPHAVVHNAGITAVGCVEEMDVDVWQHLFTTNLFGPVALTKVLLPSMRAAGRGRIVVISSEGGVRGMPAIAAYSAAKGASERWAEAMAGEVAPFGLGVTIIVTGTFDTDILTDAGVQDYRDFDGAYGPINTNIDRRGRLAIRIAGSPERFARGLAKALDDTAPLTRRAVGPDAHMLLISNRFLPNRLVQQVTRVAMGIPRFGSLRSDSVA